MSISSNLLISYRACHMFTFCLFLFKQTKKITFIITCLSLLIWETQPKTYTVADKEPIINLKIGRVLDDMLHVVPVVKFYFVFCNSGHFLP